MPTDSHHYTGYVQHDYPIFDEENAVYSTLLCHWEKDRCCPSILLLKTFPFIIDTSWPEHGPMSLSPSCQEICKGRRHHQKVFRTKDIKVIFPYLWCLSPCCTARMSGNTLRIGFMSCDFNDHPTAHLVEGIFSVFAKMRESLVHRLELIVFSYGKDDGSIYRQNLEKVTHKRWQT